MTLPTTPTPDDLVPPAPRRSDDAFARAVRADVEAARAARSPWRLWLAAPLTAATAFGLVFMARGPEVAPVVPTADRLAVLIEAEVDAEDAPAAIVDVVAAVDAIDEDDALVALAGSAEAAPAFAFADLDGSSEQDLAAVEAALDRALARL
jgi:hypothetical protein